MSQKAFSSPARAMFVAPDMGEASEFAQRIRNFLPRNSWCEAHRE